MEIARPFYSASAEGTYCVPYGFIASGYGRINAPTALESNNIHAAAFGAGLRLTFPKAGIVGAGLNLNLEYAHGIADTVNFQHANRFNAAISFRF